MCSCAVLFENFRDFICGILTILAIKYEIL
jgi:hypothetical protein